MMLSLDRSLRVCFLPLHRGLLRGARLCPQRRGLPVVHLVVGLPHHATREAGKDNVGGHPGTIRRAIEAFAVDAQRQAREDHGSGKDAVVAPDEPNVVVVDAELVLLPEDQGGRRCRRPGAAGDLQAEAGDRAGLLAHRSRLEAAAASVVSLAALVVAPAAPGVDVVQDPLARGHLAAEAAEDRSGPACGLPAGGFAEADPELVVVLREEFCVDRAVSSLGEFLPGEGFVGETQKRNHCDIPIFLSWWGGVGLGWVGLG
mmetsp:Transcript_31341/g.65739  ORF Transcript_31341/g.65739 Transcript_31341/m.65739 type:complete len:259 (-) Transcript_31341:117-893(-)